MAACFSYPRILLMLMGLVIPASFASAQNADRLRSVIASETRTVKNTARDIYRHPFETLMFFGIEPSMTVVEIWPGAGWYSEILAPYLAGKGRLYAASWDQSIKGKFIRRTLSRYKKKFIAKPEIYGDVVLTELSRIKTDIAPPDSVDMVLTFRSVHIWMKRGYEGVIFAALYRALKPGGVLGVVENRGNSDTWQDTRALSGYVNEEYVIDLAEEAGFELVASSEVNANPKDTVDHEKGVRSLPPLLRRKDNDYEYYRAIGESDRMTLKFIKPDNG